MRAAKPPAKLAKACGSRGGVMRSPPAQAGAPVSTKIALAPRRERWATVDWYHAIIPGLKDPGPVGCRSLKEAKMRTVFAPLDSARSSCAGDISALTLTPGAGVADAVAAGTGATAQAGGGGGARMGGGRREGGGRQGETRAGGGHPAMVTGRDRRTLKRPARRRPIAWHIDVAHHRLAPG